MSSIFFNLESKHITGHELCSAWRRFPQISMCNVKMYDSCKGVHQQFACTILSHTYRGQKDGCKTREILKLLIYFPQFWQLVKRWFFKNNTKVQTFTIHPLLPYYTFETIQGLYSSNMLLCFTILKCSWSLCPFQSWFTLQVMEFICLACSSIRLDCEIWNCYSLNLCRFLWLVFPF